MRYSNKLKRINLVRNLNIIKFNNFFKKKVFTSSFMYLSYYGLGWSRHNFYGICTKIYKTKNFQVKLKLFNVKQKINFTVNLNQNLLINLKVKN